MSSSEPTVVKLHRYEGVGENRRTVDVVEYVDSESAETQLDWTKQIASEAAVECTITFRRKESGFVAAWDPPLAGARAMREAILESDLLVRGLVAPNSSVAMSFEGLPNREGKQLKGSIPATPIALPRSFERVRTRPGLETQISKDIELALPRLVAQLRSPLGVMPFVGAGMSARFGLPQWNQFLETLATQTVDRDGELERLRRDSDLEALAEVLWKRSENAFQNEIDARFNRDVPDEQLLAGPLAILARLVDGPVITTNFDHVLESTFRACGRAFDGAVHGPKPDSIVRAIHRNQRHLLKIHGDCRDRADRTFTRSEYERHYGDGGGTTTLTSLGWLMFTHRPLLFLGCSLERDRTVDVLGRVQRELAGIEHFAVLAAKYRENKLAERREELASLGITPLWFAPGDFGRIDRHLALLVELTTSRELRPARLDSPPRPLPSAASPQIITARRERRKAAAVTQRIASAIRDGRVAFLLGSYVHLGAIGTGNAFYQEMARHFEAPQALRDRSEVARHVLDRYGAQELLAWYREFVGADDVAPSTVVKLLGELPSILRESRGPNAAGVTLITTNYDLVLERALEAANEPYHRFYYLSEGADAGRFAYRSPDGAERIIERPDHFHVGDDPRVCLVKLNGGLLHGEKFPHSVCIAHGDFERLAGRLPDCLPAGVRARIEDRSLLCLGHGLRELDVETLIRHVQSRGPRRKSWAVQMEPRGEVVEYWKPIGLEIVDRDLGEFADELGAALVN